MSPLSSPSWRAWACVGALSRPEDMGVRGKMLLYQSGTLKNGRSWDFIARRRRETFAL